MSSKTQSTQGLGTGASLEQAKSYKESRKGGFMKKIISALVVYFLVIIPVVGWWWSLPPRANLEFDLPENPVPGHATTQAVIQVADTLLHKQAPFKGGYVSNDKNLLFPGIYIDNIKNWEFGALIQLRDTASALRNSFGKPRSQGQENSLLAEADPKFQSDNMYWLFPRAENVYAEGIGYLEKYISDLNSVQDSDVQFYTRADNLELWLGTVSTRLGDYSQRLSNSKEKMTINVDLAGDAEAEQSTPTQDKLSSKTPLRQVDDHFYEAQGYAWATVQILRAMTHDFDAVLEKKNAAPSFEQILEDLQETQQMILSPMILNGDGYGFVANHSLWLANYISRANAAVIDLRDLLKNG